MDIPAQVSSALPPDLLAAARAFEAAGAVSPADARPLAEVPGLDVAAAVALAARAIVREAEPGRYYLDAGTARSRRTSLLTRRVAAHVVVAVPADLCAHAVQAALGDARLRDARGALRPGKEYSGWVTGGAPGGGPGGGTARRLALVFAALDPATGRRTHGLGWRVTYDFTPAGDGRTRVEVGVEYTLLAANAAAGTLRAQAENDIAHRLAAMHALELGFGGRAGALTPSTAGIDSARTPPETTSPASTHAC